MARHTGLLPFAEPTARGCVPSCRASSPYGRVSPGGIARKAAQTRRWNGVPSGSTATPSNARTLPAKYARTWSLIGVGARVPSNGSSKRRAWRASPRSARWIGPIGVSTVSTRSMFTPSGKPDGGCGIRPPRPPGLRALEQSARCPSEGTAKAQVGSGDGVASEVLENRSGVGAQIEHALDAGGDLECPRRQGRRHARLQMRRSTATHFQPAFRQPAPPGAVADLLDGRQRARREEREQRLEIERRAKRQPQPEVPPPLPGRPPPQLPRGGPQPPAPPPLEAAKAVGGAGRLRGGCGRKKDDVFAARQTRRAAWTAIDVRRPHAEEEAAGEASIAALDRAVAGFGIHGGNE